jgi:hypothetical protein
VKYQVLATAAVTLLTSAVSALQPERRVSPVFSSYELLELTLAAPYPELFDRARANPEYSVIGTLSYLEPASGRTIVLEDVTIETRGHTSRRATECEFPKLKVVFTSPPPADSLFAGMQTIKIGTHCDDRPDGQLTPRYGRWANEKAPHREAFVYRLLEAMGVAALKARPARISYAMTGPASRTPPVIRNAMLLEDDDAAIARLGGAGQVDPKQFTSADTTFSPEDTARVAFAQAMIGNFDWCLRMTAGDTYRCNDTTPLWNVMAVHRGGRTVPVIHDFDIAGLVVGRHLWFGKVFNASFATSEPAVEVLAQVQRTRSLFPRRLLDATRRDFSGRKNSAYQALAASTVDEDGRQRIRLYLDAFFGAIEADDAFYRPVIIDRDARMYADDSRREPLCGDGLMPVGTPVSAPLETRGDMAKVFVLDALWHWSEQCEAVRREPVWIPAGAMGTDYPVR